MIFFSDHMASNREIAEAAYEKLVALQERAPFGSLRIPLWAYTEYLAEMMADGVAISEGVSAAKRFIANWEVGS